MDIKINGKTVSVDVTPDTPLLWVIRDELNMTGTKFGCGISQCGACTVHVNGVATRSCTFPIAAAANAEITTIEGAQSKVAKEVQAAWAELSVPQCGYCQSGQIMAATALLAKNAQPKDADIDAAMNNICRCGTYNEIRAAIKKAAAKLV